MTNPQQMRIALSEIPDRLGALRVATTPTNGNHRTPNEPTPANAFNPPILDNTTNVALSQDSILSPVASPDELVIRQRGRRSFTTWSPDNCAAAGTIIRSPFQRTPTKMPLTSSMILRSSPRKRFTMGSTPPEPVTPKTAAKQQLWPGTPISKKLRLGDDERPFAQINSETPIVTLLQGMSRQQLIDIIVVNYIAGDVKAEEKLRANLPTPEIDNLEQELLHVKRNIFKSLPTSRLCKKTDSIAYSRASLHLTEFKRLLTTHMKNLYDSSHWDALVDYVVMAWPFVRATPLWDSTAHNLVRRQCFKLLTCHCIAAIKYAGTRLGNSRLHTLERNLRDWSKDYEDVLSCVNTLNKVLSKGRNSL